MSKHHAWLEALEPRILYSADLAAVLGSAVDSTAAAAAQVQLVQAPQLQLSQFQISQQQPWAQALVVQELAFVDLGISDAPSLIAGLTAQRDAGRALAVFTIAAHEDGVAAISQALQNWQNLPQNQGQQLAALHLFSHGSDGQVQLGSSPLNGTTAVQRAAELAGWGTALTADADLLIYGCDVASTAQGQDLLATLAALTGADTAASSNATGASARGGDWALETSSGPIEAAVAAGSDLQQSWPGLLGTEFQVNTHTPNNQSTEALGRGSQQAVAVDGAGNYVVVWTSSIQDGDGDGVYARRFAQNGTPLSGEFLVNTTTQGNQNQARVVADNAGNFVVVWAGSDDGGTSSGVFMRAFDATGAARGAEVGVNTTTTGEQTGPVVGMNAATGDFVVAWQGQGATDAVGIAFRRYSAAGAALDATERAANTTDSGSENGPAVAIDSTGRVVVAFEVNSHMYVQRFDASGAAAGARVQVDNALSNSTDPSIAMDAAGNFTLVYREEGTLAPGVWGRGYLADGSSRYSWFYVDAGDSANPSIAMAADGAFVVSYEKTGADATEVFARKYNANGSAHGAAFAVNQYTTESQGNASVSLLSHNEFVVVWSGKTATDSYGVAALSFENAAPVITSLSGAASAALTQTENSTAATTVTATDADGDALTYSISGGADAARFSIAAGTGVLSFVAAPNFEAPADANANNIYEVTVQVSDGVASDTQALAISVSNQAITSVGISGAATVTVGGIYELTLTANEDATAWTVNWGDGTITSYAGNPAWVGHVYTRQGYSFNILASATDALGTVHPHELLVPAYTGGDSVFRFAANTGAFVQEFATSDGLNDPVQGLIGPDGLLYVSGEASNTVLRYNATTGAFVDTFVTAGSGGLNSAGGMAFGADGNLYVASWAGNQVLRYDGNTGAYIDAFIGSVNRPYALAFGPDDQLYVGLYNTHEVRRFNADTGALVGVFVSAGSGGLTTPEQIVFGPDGDLYVASSGTDQVLRYNGTTGAFRNAFVAAASGGLDKPSGLAFGPDGQLYVSSEGGNNVLRYNGTTGAFLNTYVAAGSGGLATPALLTFAPGRLVEVLAAPSNTAPVVATPLADQNATDSFVHSHTFGAGTFADADVGDTLSYSATLASGAALPGWLSFNTSTRTFSGTPSPADVGAISVRVTATDTGAASVFDEFTLTVSSNLAPVITSHGGGATGTASVTEGQTGVATVTATDSNLPAQTISYVVSGGTDSSKFAINSSTGALTFYTAPLAASPTDTNGDNVYQVVVRASDGVLFDEQVLNITVVSANPVPQAVADSYSLQEDQTLAATVASGWYDAAWAVRSAITLNNASGPVLTDTVVLVTLDSSTVDYSRTQNGGQDLRFVSASGQLLAHEIDTWDEAGVSRVWVRLPSIAAASTTESFWMYYGNAAAADGQQVAQTWPAATTAVLHLGSTLFDSTSNANAVTESNTLVVAGRIGQAREFNGLDSWVSLGSAAVLDDAFLGGGTFSAWINPSGWGEAGYGRVASKADSTFPSGANGIGWNLELAGASQSLLFEIGFGGARGAWKTPTGSISLNTWQQVSVVYDSSSAANVPRIYINGAEVALSVDGTPTGAPVSDAAMPLRIGNQALTTDRSFAGSIDQVRLQDGLRTAAQVSADYRSSAGTLAGSVGAAQVATPGVLNNDNANGGGAMTAEIVTGPAHASSFTLNPNGTFSYTPVAHYNGSDSFSYLARNSSQASATVTVNLNVSNVADAPLALTDAYAVSQNAVLNVAAGVGLLANDSDADADALRVLVAGNPAHGSLSLTPSALPAFTNLSNNAAADTRAAWSSDGSRVAFDTARDGNNEIYVVALAGGGATRLTNNAGDDSQAAWSPDGTRIAFMSNRDGNYDLWVMNAADGSGLVQLAATASGVSGQPAWSPDGSKIAFTSDRAGAGFDIYVVNTDGSGLARLTTSTGNDDEPAWSADGGRIAFTSARDGNSEIYVMNANGTGQTRVTNHAALDRAPDWSADGSKLSWVSDRGGLQQLFIMDTSGSNPVQVTFDASGVSFADWSADGTQFVFTQANEVKTAALSYAGGFVYTPTAGYAGMDSFSYTVIDSTGLTSNATANITVQGASISAQNDSATTAADTALTVNVLANDLPGPGGALQVMDVSTPSHGTVAMSAGQLTYTPSTGYVGADSMRYLTNDAALLLSHHWQLDGHALDAVGGSSGTLVNGPVTTAGVYGNAVQFDGVNDHAQLPDVNYSDEFTLSFWFKLPDNIGTGYDYLYSHGATGTSNSLNVFFIEDATATASGVQNVLRTRLLDGDDTDNVSGLDIPATMLADNQWHQYTLTTTTGTGTQVYIDGALRASTANGGGAINPAGSVHLGGNNSLSVDRLLTGSLDGVALYARSLNSVEVAAQAPGGARAATLAVTVAPTPQAAPVITSNGGGASATLTLNENSTAVTTVVATDSDLPAQALVYTLSGGADAALFELKPTTGVLVLLAAPNFEAPTDANADGVYEVQVQVSDGSLVATQTLSVQVADVNEFSVSNPVDNETAANQVLESAPVGSTVGLTAGAFDADGSNPTITYTLDNSAGGLFSIDATSGVVRVAGLLDAETARNHLVTVRATSSDGSWRVGTFNVAVLDSNEFNLGPLGDTDAAPDGVAETAPAGTPVGLTLQAVDADTSNNSVTYALSDDAGGRFAIDPVTGVVSLARTLGEAGLTSHTVWAVAQSADGSSSTQSFALAVTLVNNQTPVITSHGGGATALLQVLEGPPDGGPVPLGTVSASDADLPAQTLVYHLAGGADAARFSIDRQTGVLSLWAPPNFEQPTDADGNGVYEVTVSASDGQLQDLQSFSVQVLNVDEAPQWLGNTLVISEGGRAVPGVALFDEDSLPAVLQFSVQGLGGGHFEHTGAPGVAVGVFSQADLNAGTLVFVADGTEAAPTYQLVASDGSTVLPANSPQVVFAPVDDAPLFTYPSPGMGAASPAVLTVDENNRSVATLAAADVDTASSSLRYSVHPSLAAAADAALFVVDSTTGLLSFSAAPDHEQPSDSQADGRYELMVGVSDGNSTTLQAVTVVVANVDEAPVMLRQAIVLTETGATLDLQAADPEGLNALLTYEVLSTQGGQFEWAGGSAAAGTVANAFSQADLDALRVQFVPAGTNGTNGVTPGFMLALNDGAHRVILAAPEVVRQVPTAPPAAAPAKNTVGTSSLPPADSAAARSGPAAAEPAAPVLAAPVPTAVSATAAAPATAPLQAPEAPLSASAAEPRPALLAETPQAQQHRFIEITSAQSSAPSGGESTAFWSTALATLSLPSESLPVFHERTTLELLGGRGSTALAQAMDATRAPDADGGASMIEMGTAGTVLVSSGLSVGYVLWLARGGVLAASLMSSVPAWASVDPLPVLAQMRKGGTGAHGTGHGNNDPDESEDEDFDPIERLFSRANQGIKRLMPGTAPSAASATTAPAVKPTAPTLQGEASEWAT